MQHLFDMRPDRPGYRLQRLEVFNWGTFDSSAGNCFRFEPEGRTTLLVGHNGSGKSTLVDAVLTLLVDGKTRNYNVAAGGNKTERTLKSYIKGAFDRTSDEMNLSVVKYLRPQGNHLTAISAVFKDEQLNKAFTLTQILFLKTDGSEDRIFAIADQAHELQHDLQGLNKSSEVREHLKQRGYQTTKAYVEYHGWLAKRTQMRSKAIAMFNQTVAVKDIQNLNEFIRKHMLESQNWNEKVQGLLKHFNDLSIAHNELVRAQAAQELLIPVEKLGKKYREKKEELNAHQMQLDAADSYFPSMKIEIFEPELAVQKKNLITVETVIERLDRELNLTRETIRQLRNEIEQAGGDRLRQIPSLIKIEEKDLDHKRERLQEYQLNLNTCGIKEVIGSRDQFLQMDSRLRKMSETTTAKLVELKQSLEETIGRKASLERELRVERNELEVLQRQRSNLPSRFTEIRSRLCADLNLDESVLPFAAELISVLPEEQTWTASIEMVLRSFALSLLVPERYYTRVRSYVENFRITDERGNGQRLDYLCVAQAADSNGDRIHPQSLCHKLKFKPQHELTPWIREEVQQRFDFRCCNSVEEFDALSRNAMTSNCHIKFNKKRHQKDDRERTTDPRYFVLGWDNTQKKRRVALHIQEMESEHIILSEALTVLENQIEQLQHVSRAIEFLLGVTDFDTLDIKRHQEEIVALQEEKNILEESNDAVRALQNRLKQIENQEQTLNQQRDAQLTQKANLERDIQSVTKLVETACVEVEFQKRAGLFESHEKSFDAIAASLGEPELSIEDFDQRTQRWKTKTQKLVDALRSPLEKCSQQLTTAMTKYLQKFPEESVDLDSTPESLESFQGVLDQLREEDLPRYERKFKNRLNDQVSQEIALFNTELRLEQTEINNKISLLNKALSAVEYSAGTFMRLKPHLVKDHEIEDFRRSLRECLDDSLEQTPQAHEARFLRIKKLIERLDDNKKTTWRNKVIDVRNWYNFAAEEVERESNTIRSCYNSSSGQSGGEKAKLAFTILVAALAYQFDIDPTGNVPGRFQFVVVDEMFSKVDDQNAEYALKLFSQFGLQLLIVAPLDAKARVTEPFVDRYLHVVKQTDTNHSKLYSITAREYEKVVDTASDNRKTKTKQTGSV